jgi:hypothetical protein
MMRDIIIRILLMVCVVVVSGCAINNEPEFAIQPEKPWLQQYYQLPQDQYYTGPKPQLQYWDPRQDPLWQQEQADRNQRKELRYNRLQKGSVTL